MDTKIIAHRGASGLVEFDNSMESFKKAIEIGADMVEFDVRKTKDNRLIAFHDYTLDDKSINELEYDTILEITEEKGYKVPTVEDVVMLCKDKIGLDIELKEEGYEDEIIDLVSEHLDYDQFMMKSFSDRSVDSISNHDSEVQTGLLLGVKNPDNKFKTRLSELFPKKRLKKCDADFVSPNHQLLKLMYLKRMDFRGFPVYVWTVNDPVMILRLIEKGVDGVITDRPDIALDIQGSIK